MSTGQERSFDVGKKDCQDRNNARNRDAFAICKANGMLRYDAYPVCSNDRLSRGGKADEIESAIIEVLDLYWAGE